ncbi:hypothetical protein Tco_0729568 [Tanacetum coccineum]|uniref:Uncharacterized protein n=1 Tax=Tanacetum coccineum TaxID=301880 RepID=A0ABQ4YS07_9ASTR
MLPKETDNIERFVWGLPDSIQGNVTSSKPTRLQKAIEIANSLMDQKIYVFAARQADNKRRMEKNPRDDNVQQLPYKRQNVARAWEKKDEARGRVYALGGGEADQDPNNIADDIMLKERFFSSCLVKPKLEPY